MDIEGMEFESLLEFLSNPSSPRVDQILIELHRCDRAMYMQFWNKHTFAMGIEMNWEGLRIAP